jgi:hypothetical protein
MNALYGNTEPDSKRYVVERAQRPDHTEKTQSLVDAASTTSLAVVSLRLSKSECACDQWSDRRTQRRRVPSSRKRL